MNFYLLIDSFNKYLLSIYSVLDTLFDSKDSKATAMTKQTPQQSQNLKSCGKIHPPSGIQS